MLYSSDHSSVVTVVTGAMPSLRLMLSTEFTESPGLANGMVDTVNSRPGSDGSWTLRQQRGAVYVFRYRFAHHVQYGRHDIDGRGQPSVRAGARARARRPAAAPARSPRTAARTPTMRPDHHVRTGSRRAASRRSACRRARRALQSRKPWSEVKTMAVLSISPMFSTVRSR